jgi:hypothetical protein
MKKFVIAPRGRTPLALAFLLPLGLTSALWVATIPVAVARMMTATEMIEAGLPPGVVMKTANKPQFLTAVCGAVKNHRKAAPAIAETAVAAHREYAGDIVATVVRCSNGNCELTAAIVASATTADPDSAVAIDDAATAIAPDCADAIQAATSKSSQDVPAEGPANSGGPPPINQPVFIDSGGGGGGVDPQAPIVGVCDNGREHRIPIFRVPHFLQTHPGSFVGRCQITPVTSP